MPLVYQILPLRGDRISTAPSKNQALLAQTASPSITQTQAGLEFEGFGTPNMGTITDTIFRGECPGEGKGNIKARFYSTTPPSDSRRVVIRNMSRGLAGDTTPGVAESIYEF
jgi:hypothetical protein